jgi:hypothetical protein
MPGLDHANGAAGAAGSLDAFNGLLDRFGGKDGAGNFGKDGAGNFDFGDLSDFGIDENGKFDLDKFNFDKLPQKGEDGYFPLPDKIIDAIKGLEDIDINNFDPSKFDLFPEGFDVADLDLEYDVPALLAKLAEILEQFDGFEPSPELLASLNEGDLMKVQENLKASLKDLLDFEIPADQLESLSNLLAEKIPSKDDIVALGIAEDLAQRIADKHTELVDELSNINFFKDMTPEQIKSEVEAKLKEYQEIFADLKAGLPENMDLDKFLELVNKAGFDTQGLKDLLADPTNFNFGGAKGAPAAAAFSKQQVANQADLAKTQEEEKERQQQNSSATTIAISTLSIAVSAVAYVF